MKGFCFILVSLCFLWHMFARLVGPIINNKITVDAVLLLRALKSRRQEPHDCLLTPIADYAIVLAYMKEIQISLAEIFHVRHSEDLEIEHNTCIYQH